MKKLITVAISVLAFVSVSAQNYTEPMKRLIGYVTELRTDGSDDSVYLKLAGDDCWTLMNEIGQVKGECSRSAIIKMKRFGINDLAYRAESQTRGRFVSASNFCNGTDPRFNYSFIEKTIVARDTVSYEIPGRTGLQTFVIVPFSTDSKLSAGVIVADEDYGGTVDSNGNIVIEADAGNDANNKLVLCVGNPMDKPMSYVIINYNSRQSR